MSISGIFLAYAVPLGVVGTARNTAFTGDAFALLPCVTDDVASADQRFAVSFHLKQTGAGTVRALVLTSVDGVVWVVAAESSLLSGDGAEVFEVVEVSRLLRFVAVVSELGGEQAPSHVLGVSLLSNGRFALNKVSKTVSAALAVAEGLTEAVGKSGRASLPSGQSAVNVIFSTPWEDALYSVSALPEGAAVSCWVSDVSESGFCLHTSAPVGQDTPIHWFAVHD
jgi:hypothetical protein